MKKRCYERQSASDATKHQVTKTRTQNIMLWYTHGHCTDRSFRHTILLQHWNQRK